MYDALRTLAGQLLAVPGAPDKLLAEYFSNAVPGNLPGCTEEYAVEVWQLSDALVLSLLKRPQGLVLKLSRAGLPMDTLALPMEVLSAASPNGDQFDGPYRVSPLLLALTAIAAGYLDGDRVLRRFAPRLLKGAQEVLLIAACRLCG